MNFLVLFLISIASISLWVSLPVQFYTWRGVEHKDAQLLTMDINNHSIPWKPLNTFLPKVNSVCHMENTYNAKVCQSEGIQKNVSAYLRSHKIIHVVRPTMERKQKACEVYSLQVYKQPKISLLFLLNYLFKMKPYFFLADLLQAEAQSFLDWFLSKFLSELQLSFEAEFEHFLLFMKPWISYLVDLVPLLPFICLSVALYYKWKEQFHLQKGIKKIIEATKCYPYLKHDWNTFVTGRREKPQDATDLTNNLILKRIFSLAYSFGEPLFKIRETVDKDFQKEVENFTERYIKRAIDNTSRKANIKALNRNMARRKQAWVMDIGTTDLDEILGDENLMILYKEAHENLSEKLKDKSLLCWHTSDFDFEDREKEEEAFLKSMAKELWKLKWPKDV